MPRSVTRSVVFGKVSPTEVRIRVMRPFVFVIATRTGPGTQSGALQSPIDWKFSANNALRYPIISRPLPQVPGRLAKVTRTVPSGALLTREERSVWEKDVETATHSAATGYPTIENKRTGGSAG